MSGRRRPLTCRRGRASPNGAFFSQLQCRSRAPLPLFADPARALGWPPCTLPLRTFPGRRMLGRSCIAPPRRRAACADASLCPSHPAGRRGPGRGSWPHAPPSRSALPTPSPSACRRTRGRRQNLVSNARQRAVNSPPSAVRPLDRRQDPSGAPRGGRRRSIACLGTAAPQAAPQAGSRHAVARYVQAVPGRTGAPGPAQCLPAALRLTIK